MKSRCTRSNLIFFSHCSKGEILSEQIARYGVGSIFLLTLWLCLAIVPVFAAGDERCHLSHEYIADIGVLSIDANDEGCLVPEKQLKKYLIDVVNHHHIKDLRHVISSARAIFTPCLRDKVPQYGDWPKNYQGLPTRNLQYKNLYLANQIMQQCVIGVFPMLSKAAPLSVSNEKVIFTDWQTQTQYTWVNNYAGMPDTAQLSDATIWVKYD